MDSAGHIRIDGSGAWLNGELVLENKEQEFAPFAKGLYRHLGLEYSKFFKMSPLSKLGFLGSELLLKDTDPVECDKEEFSLVLANSSSSLHTDAIYQESIAQKPSPAIFVYTLPNIVIGEICIRNKFKGEGIFFIQEEFDREFIFSYVRDFLLLSPLSMCIAGWLELSMEGSWLAELWTLKQSNN